MSMLKKRYVVLVPLEIVTEHYVEANSESDARQFVENIVTGKDVYGIDWEDYAKGTTYEKLIPTWAVGYNGCLRSTGIWSVYDSETDEWAEKEESLRQSSDSF
jgi:hypothetical protein